MKNRWHLLAYVLLLILFAQVTLAARYTSITLDEPLHITSGYASLVTGDYRLVEEHPPLLKMIQALPLLLAEPSLPDPRTVAGWGEKELIETAQHVVVPYRPIEPVVFAARVPTMLVAAILGALVFRWAMDIFGVWAGLTALTLFVFDPNILAHAGVAATDLGAACAIFAAMYTYWRWLSEKGGPSWRRCLVAAIVLGLALGVKSTTLLLLPVFGVLLLFARPPQRPLRLYMGQAFAAGGVAFLVLWATYRFEIGPVPGWSLPLPAASHFLPLIKLQQHMQSGHSAFLMGENYHMGKWYYFPVAFVLKTPPLTLVLSVLTALSLVIRRVPSPGWRGEAAILAVPLVYSGVSLTSTLNIGYRHLLPVLPFMFVWVSRLAPAVNQARAVWRWGARLALAGYAIFTLTLFPWYLGYFNLFAGGMDGGYRFLTDSNLDWGQTWKALQGYLDERGITKFSLSQYTINDPRAYGLEYEPLPPWPDAEPVLPRRFNPAPGVYAISATTLQGVVVADPEMFDYFRQLEPVARVGHAMFVYEIETRPVATWVAQCTNPVAPLPPAVLLEGIGQDNVRLAYFDCSQSWLYPEGNGWYVLARDSESQMTRSILAEPARLAYQQKRASFVPPFEVYEWFGADALANLRPEPVYAAPSAWPPPQVESEGVLLEPPVRVGDGLEFLVTVVPEGQVRAGSELAIKTYWRVIQRPAQPLSLMAHVLDTNGVPIAVGDGLGVPIDQWQPGDVIMQRHSLQIPSETSPAAYWVQVGAYNLPDIQRLPVYANTQNGTLGREDVAVGDRLLVDQLKVVEP